MDARIAPDGRFEALSRLEIAKLRDAGSGGLYELWRQCSLAVLNSGAEDDDVRKILRQNETFEISIVELDSGVALDVRNAPESAFVDGEMIRGIREHLFAVLRDLLYAYDDVLQSNRFDLGTSQGITDAVFHMLRNAHTLQPGTEPKLIVCWGGHAISRAEYDYSKTVGYALGLRKFDICTGCGAGAMKGPMKGAALGHAKQRVRSGRFVGFTEPTIIAAEAPNPLVNELVILPDMEKRLEAFVRTAHAIVIFPGGVGTAEEMLYLLGILLREENEDVHLPVVFTGPRRSEPYFDRLHDFIGRTLGERAQARYEIIMDDPHAVGAEVARRVRENGRHARPEDSPYFFNWQLDIGLDFQQPFEATHESMAALELHYDQPPDRLAVNLRRAFAGIVGGNVRESGIRLVEQYGPFELNGDPRVVSALGDLLRDFVDQGRMKLSDPAQYVPCYRMAS